MISCILTGFLGSILYGMGAYCKRVNFQFKMELTWLLQADSFKVYGLEVNKSSSKDTSLKASIRRII